MWHWLFDFSEKIDLNCFIKKCFNNKATYQSMGIKHLNQFVKRECPGAIKTVSFADMAGKVIVVDASIYMYRFAADDALLENMYSMIRMFQLNGVVPVFIFDGKPPDEKRKLLNKRQRLKRIAEMHYNEVKNKLELTNASSENEHLLKALKRRFIRLHDSDFERVRTLLQALGVNYIVAPGEADVMCAQMVLKRKAHACASDDTDLFVYGCPRVLRHLNLMDQTMTMYDMSKILELLGMTMTEFRQICVVSGTDYAISNLNHTESDASFNSVITTDGVCAKTFNLHLKLTLKLFKQYKKCVKEAEETDGIVATDFYTWLHYNHKSVNPRLKFDYNATIEIHDMFETPNSKISKSLCVATINPTIDYELLCAVMSHENFIFV